MIIYYRKNGGVVSFTDGYTPRTYWGYTKREAYKLYKEYIGIKRAKLVEDNHPITYGYLY